MPQILLPDSAATNTNWSVTGSSEEDVLGDDDSTTYVTCDDASNELEIVFAAPTQTPITGSCRIRMWAKGAGAVSWRLLDNTTVVKTGQWSGLPTAFQGSDYDAEGWVDAVVAEVPSAWNDLRVELVADRAGIVVHRLLLDVPDGTLDPNDERKNSQVMFTGRLQGQRRTRWA